MAAPAFKSAGSQVFGTSNALSPTCPATVDAGDLLLLFVFSWRPNTVTTDPTVDTPTGFTPGISKLVPESGGVDDGILAVFYKWAAGTEDGATVSVTLTGDTGNDTSSYAQIASFSGCVGSGTPWDDIQAASNLASSTITVPAVTVSGSERTLVGCAARGASTASPVAPSGYTHFTGGVFTVSSTTGADMGSSAWTLANVSSDGSVTSSTATNWAAVHMSLKPAASGTAHTASPADTLVLSDSVSPVHTPGAAPGPAFRRQRRASRFLTFR